MKLPTQRALPPRVTPTREPFSARSDQSSPDPFASESIAQPSTSEGVLAEETFGFVDGETFDERDDQGESNVALEILITWGSSVLHVAHLSPPRSFVIGEPGHERDKVDFLVPAETLGRRQLQLVAAENGVVQAIIPDVAEGKITSGESCVDLREVMDSAELSPVVTRARHQQLKPGLRVTMTLPGIEVRVGMVRKAEPMERGILANVDWNVPSYFGMTAGMAVALMTSLSYFVPPQGLTDDDGLSQERLMLISHYLDAASEREQEAIEQPEEESGANGGAEAKRAEGAEGEAGKVNAPKTSGRVAVVGPRENRKLELSEELLKEINNSGLIGLLRGDSLSDPNAPRSIFGDHLALGSDDVSAQGSLWGDEIGESGGMGGLGLASNGFGGGDLYGKGVGFGVGQIGTIGLGQGKHGFGNGVGLPGGEHKTRTPQMRTNGVAQVSGRIPPHVIRRIVRQNFGRFRMCYEQGLARNPNLEGRIAIRFVIGRDGAVSNTSAGGDIPDSDVKSCIASAFYGLSFPPPDGGVVRVTYPLMFTPQ